MLKAKKTAPAILALALLFSGTAGWGLPPEDVQAEGQRLGDSASGDMILIKSRGYRPAPMTLDAQAGKKIFDKNGCTHCHTVQGDGGYLGPMLDGVGAFRSRRFLIERLSGKAETKPFDSGLMNHVKLDSTDARLISEYLLTLPEPKNLFVAGHPKAPIDKKRPAGFHFLPAEKSESSQAGQAIYNKYACVACHQIAGHGGHLGPTLDGVGARRSRDYIAARVVGGAIDIAEFPSAKHCTVYKMPPFKLNQEQVEQLVDYLMTLPERR
jgi:sulfur oxidation c-type cytochrome SoxX